MNTKKEPLYEDKNFTSWNINRVAEVIFNEWQSLSPTLQPNTVTAYSDRLTRISFRGEVSVTLDIAKDKYPNKDSVEIALLLRLSPDPNNLTLHVLNTVDIGTFLFFPELKGKKPFSIKKMSPGKDQFYR